ncbi:membrane protein [Aureimonas endophytica]|uniref:Membrane protein n=1 Tax=Aureimonas endophytica TaxID=2027858 RepID=A0A916ZSE6_9HYPH|nr:PepSY-associated TM helix domain-containing protein [Aureimonas endophytica]GGE09059.1 membrane protein [Aureimonas endophytica]
MFEPSTGRIGVAARPRSVDQQPVPPDPGGAAFQTFVARLHLHIGLFVGPFLLVAALTGTLYVLTPQIEDRLYRAELTTEAQGPARPLAEQARAARAAVAADLRLVAVRPAPGPGRTTRVLFADPALGPSETRAVFVDPATLVLRGVLVTYGTSGILPFRTLLDNLHRSLLLGEFGRAYSELAASWLWVATLGGTLLWAWRRTGRLARRSRGHAGLRLRHRHGVIGVTLALVLVFLSATGLTWSRWAGAGIDGLRDTLGWTTPTVRLTLGTGEAAPGGHDHAGMAMDGPAGADPAGRLDAVLAAARQAGIDSPLIEIRPPKAGQAWMVREVDRAWPSQVDTIALNPDTLAVTSRADFADFPLVAKLVQWGIAAHMGLLFGLPNQIVLALASLGLIVAILYGYRIWSRGRPAPGAPPRTLAESWLRLRPAARLGTLIAGAALGWCLPALGASLAAFVLIDALRWRLAKARSPQPVPAE